MKKEIFIIAFFASLIINSSFSLAVLDIQKKEIVGTIISEFNNPAEFELSIKNLGEADSFSIYSLVGVEILPNETFSIGHGETKIVNIKVYPQQALIQRAGPFNFVFKIKGVNSGIQEDVLSILITPLKDAIELGAYNFDPSSQQTTIYARNKVSYDFKNVKATFSSSFFNTDKTFDLPPFQKKEYSIELDKSKMNSLVAGPYILTGLLDVDGKTARTEFVFKFLEKSSITTATSSSGIIIRKYIVEKVNEGNLPAIATIEVKKNILSRLFTTFNADPIETKRTGFSVLYKFNKEIKPGESFLLKATTNWIFPLVLFAAILATGILVSIYTSTHVVIKKRVNYVKTKGGEFALRVTLSVRAKKFVERISLIDRVPAILKIYPKFGDISPARVDEKNRRLEWNISSLQSGEERVFSYIVFSRVGVLGKFELPTATAVFEKDGKLHETESNKVFFMNEIRNRKE